MCPQLIEPEKLAATTIGWPIIQIHSKCFSICHYPSSLSSIHPNWMITISHTFNLKPPLPSIPLTKKIQVSIRSGRSFILIIRFLLWVHLQGSLNPTTNETVISPGTRILSKYNKCWLKRSKLRKLEVAETNGWRIVMKGGEGWMFLLFLL